MGETLEIEMTYSATAGPALLSGHEPMKPHRRVLLAVEVWHALASDA